MTASTAACGAETLLDAARTAALEVGDLLRAGFEAGSSVDFKRDFHDVVTDHDRRAEQVIADVLQALVPGSVVCGEEGGRRVGDVDGGHRPEVTWYVDPIDGTGNFARGLPFFCVSIGAVRGDALAAGVVYDPIRQEVFAATPGRAECNGRPLRSRGAETDAESVLVTGFPKHRPWRSGGRSDVERYAEMVGRFRSVRRIGSSALTLAYVAAGRIDVAFGIGNHPWDVAAGALLVESADGTYLPMPAPEDQAAAAWDVDSYLAFGRGFDLAQSCLADLVTR